MSKEKDYSKKGGKISVVLNTLIAVIAIVLSGTTFYVQFFNESHNLSCCPMHKHIFGHQYSDGINYTLLFRNQGNQYEIILGMEMLIQPDKDEDILYRVTINPDLYNDPIIVRPKEIISSDISGSIDSLLLHLYDEDHQFDYYINGEKYQTKLTEDLLKCYIDIYYAKPSGEFGLERIHVSNLTYNTEFNHIWSISQIESNSKFINLTMN